MKLKKNISLLLIISIAVLLFNSCTSRVGAATSWPGFSVDGESAYLPFGAETYAINLKNGSLNWKYPSEVDRSRQAYSAPKVIDGLVVFGDYANHLVAADASNGTEKWIYAGAEDRYIASVEAAQGVVYAPNTDGYIYALDLEGDLLWKFLVDGPNWTKPIVDDTYLFVASMDHSLYAISQAYTASDLELAKNGTKTLRTDYEWKADLEMAIVADPVLEDGVIYVPTIEGKLFAIEAASGSVIWSFDNDGKLGAVWGSPVISNEIIFFADVNGDVYTVEKDSGKPHWPSAFNAGGKIVGGGALTPDGVVFATDVGKLFLINSEKEPKTITTFDNAVYSPLNYSGDNILVSPASEEGLLAAFNAEGFETWSFVPEE